MKSILVLALLLMNACNFDTPRYRVTVFSGGVAVATYNASMFHHDWDDSYHYCIYDTSLKRWHKVVGEAVSIEPLSEGQHQ